METTINNFKIKCKNNIDYSNLTCIICQSIFLNPVVLNNCGHEFCKQCIIEWKKQSFNCPICRKTNIGYNNSYTLNNIIDNIEIYCKNKDCKVIFKYGNYKDHINKCYHEIINCEYCDYNGIRKFHKNNICNEKLKIIIKEKNNKLIDSEKKLKNIVESYKICKSDLDDYKIKFKNIERKTKLQEENIKKIISENEFFKC